MSSHIHFYIGPYIKFPAALNPYIAAGSQAAMDWSRERWRDRLMFAVNESSNFDTWIPNVGNHNLFRADEYGDVSNPCVITADMISTKAFTDGFPDEITELRELYGSQGVIEFGIVTYWL